MEAVQDGGKGENGFPVLAKDVETDVSLEVDVGMVDWSCTFYLGGFVGIVFGDGYGKVEGTGGIVAFFWGEGEGEVHEVVWVGEGYGD